MRVTYVTGVSGAGKTTVAKLLQEEIPAYRWVVDLDEDGTPNAAHLEWLRWRAAEELHRATERHGRPRAAVYDPADAHVVVAGICWPHAVVDCNAWQKARKAGIAVEFVMLDVPHKVIRARLAERNGDNGDPKHFRALLRYNRQLAEVLRHQTENQRNGTVVPAHEMTAEDVAEYIRLHPLDRGSL